MRSGCESIVNGILWDMPELITRERIGSGIRIFKLVGEVDFVTRHM